MNSQTEKLRLEGAAGVIEALRGTTIKGRKPKIRREV